MVLAETSTFDIFRGRNVRGRNIRAEMSMAEMSYLHMINLSDCIVLFHDFILSFFQNRLFWKIHPESLQSVKQFGITNIRSNPMFYTSMQRIIERESVAELAKLFLNHMMAQFCFQM